MMYVVKERLYKHILRMNDEQPAKNISLPLTTCHTVPQTDLSGTQKQSLLPILGGHITAAQRVRTDKDSHFRIKSGQAPGDLPQVTV